MVFPDLTRSWNQGSNNFNQITYRTALLGGGSGLLAVAASYYFSDQLLATFDSKEFAAAAPVLTWMLLAATFGLTTTPLSVAVYAAGHAGKVLLVNVIMTAIYMTLFVLFTLWMGLIGAGAAASVAAALPPLFMVALIRRSKRSGTV